MTLQSIAGLFGWQPASQVAYYTLEIDGLDCYLIKQTCLGTFRARFFEVQLVRFSPISNINDGGTQHIREDTHHLC